MKSLLTTKGPRFTKGVVIAGLLALMFTGGESCKSSQGSTDGTGYTRTTNGAIVDVTLDEYQIHMPMTIPSGHIDFHIHNIGRMGHNLKINGNGLSKELDQKVAEGATADLMVDMQPGTYHVLCPILTHADLGMRMDLVVQ